jgi:two-component system nitrogen regulation response regulator GlnG
VRQLENICHWLTVMAPSQLIETKDLPPEVLSYVPESLLAVQADSIKRATGQDWEEIVQAVTLQMLDAKQSDIWNALCQRFETAMIRAALTHTDGRKVEAATKLGMGRNTMTRKIQELGLE